MTFAGIATPGLDLSAIVETLPVGLAVIDPAQRIILMNPAFHVSLGLDPGRFAPGTALVDAIRTVALRGVFGAVPDERVAGRALGESRRMRPGVSHAV